VTCSTQLTRVSRPGSSETASSDAPHGVEALSTVRGMHVCSVAGQQDPSVAVGRGLPSQSVNREIQVGLCYVLLEAAASRGYDS
jgi:hypothetical protein